MTAEVIQLRDYRRKEEQEAALVRLAKEVMGLIPEADWVATMHGYVDTAPCEMPPVQPDFTAPTSDPA